MRESAGRGAAPLMSQARDDEFRRHVTLVFETARKLKAVMLKRGLTRARANCPRCGVGGALQGAIAGKRNHLRMWCRTPSCTMEMME